jgi:hypothetical protein
MGINAADKPGSAAAHLNELLDEALQQTFPASDPVAIDIEAGPAGAGSDAKSRTSRPAPRHAKAEPER